MLLLYNDIDITDAVEVVSAVVHDNACGKSDSIDITLENAEAWYRWQPQENDSIRLMQDGYDSGTMFVNSIVPEPGRYRMIATGMKKNVRGRKWVSYEGKTLSDIVNACAAECGMGFKLYGIDGGIRYRYLLRCNETAPAFLNRLAEYEGCMLKAFSGRFVLISVDQAQRLEPMQTIKVAADQAGTEYSRKTDAMYSEMTVLTPDIRVTARDTDAGDAHSIMICDMPAPDAVTAGRWARGSLLCNNRKGERLTLTSEFNPGLTAMARIDIEGYTDMTGEWMIDSVEHDLVEKRSTAELLRVRRSVV